MSLEPLSPLCHDSVALQAASWDKDFERILKLCLYFSTLREIGKFRFFKLLFKIDHNCFSQLAFFLLKEGLQFCRDEQVIFPKFHQGLTISYHNTTVTK